MTEDKERVWKKLSTLPDPLLVTLQRNAGNVSISKRYILKKYLGYSDDQLDELDELLDGYSSGRQN